jgi:soluble lytic murein transglycosylase-like protein
LRDEKYVYLRNLVRAIPLFLLGSIHPAHADIYLAQDSDGVMHFTNRGGKQNGAQVFIAEPVRSRPQSEDDRFGNFSQRKKRIVQLIQNTATKYAIDPALITAIIAAESGFDPEARSRKGAVGLMQLMPATARQYGVSDSKDPTENVIAGTRHFKDLLDRHNRNTVLALAAYNAGNAPITKNANRMPPYPETMLYVSKVLALYERYRSETAH